MGAFDWITALLQGLLILVPSAPTHTLRGTGPRYKGLLRPTLYLSPRVESIHYM